MNALEEPVPPRLDLPAVPDSVPHARAVLTAFARACGADDAIAANVGLSVSEAVSNVVLHAYRGDHGAGRLTVRADCDEGLLEIVVTDEGSGLQPRTDSPGLGLGLALMAAVTTSLQLDHDGAATRVHLTFALTPAEERAEQQLRSM